LHGLTPYEKLKGLLGGQRFASWQKQK